MREINLIVIHCADTYASMDIGVETIRKWHVEERGWDDVGYHDIIRRSGEREAGRSLEIAGAHAKGYNSNSIGICLIGGKGDDDKCEFNFTRRQMHMLAALVNTYTERFPGIEIVGHRDLDSRKQCPSFDIKSFFELP